jgi:hypothetical protein
MCDEALLGGGGATCDEALAGGGRLLRRPAVTRIGGAVTVVGFVGGHVKQTDAAVGIILGMR